MERKRKGEMTCLSKQVGKKQINGEDDKAVAKMLSRLNRQPHNDNQCHDP